VLSPNLSKGRDSADKGKDLDGRNPFKISSAFSPWVPAINKPTPNLSKRRDSADKGKAFDERIQYKITEIQWRWKVFWRILLMPSYRIRGSKVWGFWFPRLFFSQKFTRFVLNSLAFWDNLSGFVLNSLASIAIIMAIEKSEHAEMRWRHTFHHNPFYQVNLSLNWHDILSNEV